MYSSQRALQDNGESFFFQMFFSNFEFFAQNKFFSNIDQIAMCYISMDSYQRPLQTNGKLFSNLNFALKLLVESQKYLNRVNIDRSAMYYISMDLTRQALQTNYYFFFNFGIIFRIRYNILKQ